jgi:hypothetical protein
MNVRLFEVGAWGGVVLPSQALNKIDNTSGITKNNPINRIILIICRLTFEYIQQIRLPVEQNDRLRYKQFCLSLYNGSV